jgi:hypothetical protein
VRGAQVVVVEDEVLLLPEAAAAAGLGLWLACVRGAVRLVLETLRADPEPGLGRRRAGVVRQEELELERGQCPAAAGRARIIIVILIMMNGRTV